MKKILLLILALLFIAAGCGQNKEAKEKTKVQMYKKLKKLRH